MFSALRRAHLRPSGWCIVNASHWDSIRVVVWIDEPIFWRRLTSWLSIWGPHHHSWRVMHFSSQYDRDTSIAHTMSRHIFRWLYCFLISWSTLEQYSIFSPSFSVVSDVVRNKLGRHSCPYPSSSDPSHRQAGVLLCFPMLFKPSASFSSSAFGLMNALGRCCWSILTH